MRFAAGRGCILHHETRHHVMCCANARPLVENAKIGGEQPPEISCLPEAPKKMWAVVVSPGIKLRTYLCTLVQRYQITVVVMVEPDGLAESWLNGPAPPREWASKVFAGPLHLGQKVSRICA